MQLGKTHSKFSYYDKIGIEILCYFSESCRRGVEVRQIQVMDDIHRRGEHPSTPREPVAQYEVGG